MKIQIKNPLDIQNIDFGQCLDYVYDGKTLFNRFAIMNKHDQYLFSTGKRNRTIFLSDSPIVYKSEAALNRVYMDQVSDHVRNSNLHIFPKTLFVHQLIITRDTNAITVHRSECIQTLNLHEQFVAFQIGLFHTVFGSYSHGGRQSLRLYRKLLRRPDFRQFKIMASINASYSDAYRTMDYESVAYNDRWLAFKNPDDLALARLAFDLTDIVDIESSNELSGRAYDNYLKNEAF